MAWDAQQYHRFERSRLRPALELIDRSAHHLAAPPECIVDLGCGTGHITARLAARWPRAQVTGIDRSAEMLDDAPADTGVTWRRADIGSWAPAEPVDLLFSNAALHWLDGHDEFLPRLLGAVSAGGVLAIQMPRNFDQPTHTCAFEVARDPRWRDRLEPRLRPDPVAGPSVVYDRLAAGAELVDVWETVYLHVLEGPDPVVEWTRGALLRPLLAALEPAERDEFVAAYRERIRAAYPRCDDGTTLLPYRRQFAVARR